MADALKTTVTERVRLVSRGLPKQAEIREELAKKNDSPNQTQKSVRLKESRQMM